ncbi:L-seryl-tRNA(Sec) selenium transferase [Parasalinivibrio latis]|uniref:L-seryl-tRNA(Sec) selenium transferase n=1 Tax=Parasalinivibrio latis TaxID=2952610 RepID=UPI0030E5B7A3
MTQAIINKNALYRAIPAMDALLLIPQVIGLSRQYGKAWVKSLLADMQSRARSDISEAGSLPAWCSDESLTVDTLKSAIRRESRHSLTPVINLTGTVLHTNLGRAQMCEAAIDAVSDVMRNPAPLEFDMGAGKRGHRDSRVAELVHELTGAENCCVVNNNAAAVLLMLASVAAGKEVIVSRGELVEIGGAFRIPDIMAQAGCKMVEVGCTNRTHLRDYEAAITENTVAIMKVHTSNYHICGFTHSVAEAELATLCREKGIALISDLGSGALTDLSRFGLSKEPMPQQMLADGVDLVSFSGDKLLGGPQAGLVVGKKDLIDKLQSHPLKRALRCDKMALAALEATLLQYRNQEGLDTNLPVFRKLSRPLDELEAIGENLLEACEAFEPYFDIRLTPCETQIGSGSQPDVLLASLALCFTPRCALANASGSLSLGKLDKLLKDTDLPVIGRQSNGVLLLDLRGVDDEVELEQMLRQAGDNLMQYQGRGN